MKNSKKMLIILGIAALTGYSWYSIIGSGMEEQKKYENYLQTAREKAGLGVVSGAVKNYNSALALHDSVDIRLEKAQCYLLDDQVDDFIDTCEAAVELEPFNVKPYEALMEYYFENREYSGCYDVYSETKSKDIASQSIQEYFEQMKYEYKFEFDSYDNITEYRNGYAITCNSDGYYSYVNSSAGRAFGGKYIKATPFTEGYAAVIDKSGQAMVINNNGVKTYVDESKREITDVKSYVTYGFAIQVDGKYTYVNLQFEDIGGSYDDAGAFINGFAVVRDGEKWYIVDETLKKSEKAFDHIKTDFVDVAFRMQRGFGKLGDSYYLIDTSGEMVNGEAYEDADVFFNGYAAVEKNGKWGFIDENGTQVIEPQYDDAKSFANGYAAVCRNGEWFFIDEAGEEVISGDFTGAYDMRADGCAFVCVNNKWKLLELYSFGH